jgi:drug/metabolite transporter (DMT)-like permease
VSLVWRFGLAAVVMMAWAFFSGVRLRQPWQTHLVFAGLGLCLFSMNFLLFYYGGLLVPSGLMSVVFSLSSIINMALGVGLLGNRFEPRLGIGRITAR